MMWDVAGTIAAVLLVGMFVGLIARAVYSIMFADPDE